MSAAADFHSQIASIMEVLANAAVAEICKVVDDGYAVVQLEMTRSQKENDFLRRKIKLLELQISRYRAERVKAAEGSAGCRFPGVRLLNRQNRDALAGPSLQTRTRFLNRAPASQQTVQKIQPINLDQDPDEEVVTTTKTESTEPEDELLIVKVEGATETVSPNNEAPPDARVSTKQEADDTTSGPASSKDSGSAERPVGRGNVTEVSGSGIVTFVVGTETETAHCCPLLMGSAVRAEGSRPLNLHSDMTARRDTTTASCDDVTGGGNVNVAASDVITIDEEDTSNKEEEESQWLHVDQTNTESGKHQPTTLPMIHSAGQESAGHRSVKVDPPGTSWGGTASSINSSCDAGLNLTLQRPLHPPNHTLYKPFTSRSHPPPFRAVALDRPYGCSSCTKRFFLESDLQRHMSQHTRGKPYTCSQCSKSFVCQSQLDIHRNVHTGERPFSCSICNRRFSHPSNLRRHQKIQH